MAKFTLFKHPKIYTLSDELPIANWILAMDEKIIACGTKDEPWPCMGQEAEEIDLPGEAVLPGFIDAHVHIYQYAVHQIANLDSDSKQKLGLPVEYANWIKLERNFSCEEILKLVKDKTDIVPANHWILGSGWSNAENVPNREQLDKIVPDNPVFLIDATLHSAVVNSKALLEAGINEETWDPKGGWIQRDPLTDELTGFLYEHAVNLVEKKLPAIPSKIVRKLTINTMRQLNSNGLVGVHDMESKTGYDIFPVLSGILSQNPELFTVRCLCSLQLDSLTQSLKNGRCPGAGNEYLKVGNLKLIHDGSLGLNTALMNQPYQSEDGKNYRGEEVSSKGEIKQIVKAAVRLNIPVAIHVIGDRATENIAQIWEELSPKSVLSGLRHRVEHIQSASPEVLDTLAKHGVIFSVQPLHLPGDLNYISKVQPHLFTYTHPYRDMLKKCKTFESELVFGTDFPVVPSNPLWTIYSAVTQCFPNSQEPPIALRKSNEMLTIEECLKAYTIAPAVAGGEGNLKGSLEPGKLADFISLSNDILEYNLDPEILLQTSILETYVGGRRVFNAK